MLDTGGWLCNLKWESFFLLDTSTLVWIKSATILVEKHMFLGMPRGRDQGVFFYCKALLKVWSAVTEVSKMFEVRKYPRLDVLVTEGFNCSNIP